MDISLRGSIEFSIDFWGSRPLSYSGVNGLREIRLSSRASQKYMSVSLMSFFDRHEIMELSDLKWQSLVDLTMLSLNEDLKSSHVSVTIC